MKLIGQMKRLETGCCAIPKTDQLNTRTCSAAFVAITFVLSWSDELRDDWDSNIVHLSTCLESLMT